MFHERVKNSVALGSAAVVLAGMGVLGVTGTATAAPYERCHVVKGYWTKTWHKARKVCER
ncbi:hypothetical protein [Streptomyces sp. NPDC101150]|uniref:hypothetical protein n=1 Tax=Streptomyces sp. NPDC101150 TaxID=3366114 RepID=UPI00382987AE